MQTTVIRLAKKGHSRQNSALSFSFLDQSGPTTEDIRSGKRHMELLAPAGRKDVLEAVIEAGADSVYLSGKRFQMRSHRGDFHFDNEGLREATQLVHECGKRIYVTVNTILSNHELNDARGFLEDLEEIGVDAVIVCDLAILALARELDVSYELHASTMMNVHDLDQVRMLKELGVNRIVTSRDISIREAGILGEKANIPVEYFVHGDMCVAQSGQCTLSGIAMGKSANRGECMKPCRWEYELISLHNGGVSKPLRQGHLMALRDLSLMRNVPELVDAGICALKIEGRMRDAAYLKNLVALYREVLDEFYRWPSSFYVRSKSLESLFRSRLRDLSSLSTNGAPSNSTFFDVSGKRESLMLSNGCREECSSSCTAREIFSAKVPVNGNRSVPELSISVGSLDSVRAALDAGANRVYLASETSQFSPEQWTPGTFAEALEIIAENGAKAGLDTPRVSTARSILEWNNLLRQCSGRPVHYVLAHHLGVLKRARQDLPQATILADYGFNTLNTAAVSFLAKLGAGAITLSQEASFSNVEEVASTSELPIELLAHGPLTGMLLEHCLIAINLTKSGAKDVCRAPCQQMEFAIRDMKGEERHIIADQYCRNHILAAKDLAILPQIDAFLSLRVASLRIEGQFYSPELVARLTKAYRNAIDQWKAGAPTAVPPREEVESLVEASPRPWNYGGYSKRISCSDSTLSVMKALK